MLYQVNHPNTQEWLQVDVSNLDILLENFMLNERMVRKSIDLLKNHKVSKVLHLGGFKIQTEGTEEDASVIRSLEYVLRNCTDKKQN